MDLALSASVSPILEEPEEESPTDVFSEDVFSEDGFSLVEVLFSSVTMAMVLVSLAPIFIRAMSHNLVGREASLISNFSRAGLEAQRPLPLDLSAITLADGQTARESAEYWNPETQRWQSDSSDLDASWTRNSRIRQFSIGDLYDDPAGEIPSFDSPLPGNTESRFVHVWEFGVAVVGQRGTERLGTGQRIYLTTVRSF